MKQQYSDESLVALFLSTREDRLFTQLYQRYYDKVYASALRLMGEREEAQDQTQEIFCKVHERLHTFRGESSFATWLFVLTRYHCFSARDKLKKRVHIPLGPEHEFIHPGNQEDFTLEERWQKAEAALQGLAPRDRQLLHKHYVVRESVAALASEGQLSESAVKMRLKRARDQARQLHKHIHI